MEAGMLGQRLRSLRQQRGFTLREVAEQSSLSVALLSQIENNKTEPSVGTLRKLAVVFDADVSLLFQDPEAPAIHVSRPGERFRLLAPQGLITYERLTPGRGDFEILRAQLAPGDVSSTEPHHHDSTECVFVVQGEVDVIINGEVHSLTAGESVTFDSRLPHLYENNSEGPAEFILTVSPPAP